MRSVDASVVLDRQQLREITLEDEELMRELLGTLVECTGRYMALLDAAIRDQDPERCKRLAHYAKGACANMGANAAAAVLRRMELEAHSHAFDRCAASLTALGGEIDRLRAEASLL